MATSEELLARMELILGELLGNARKMLQLTQQEFAPRELMALQALQDNLMASLVETDAIFQRDFPAEAAKKSPAMQRIEECLLEFQTINEEFVDAVRRQQTIIHFDTEGHSDEGEVFGTSQPAGGGPAAGPKKKH